MRPGSRPLAIAGYAASAAVAIGLWRQPPGGIPLGMTVRGVGAALCMILFVAGFAMRVSASDQRVRDARSILSLTMMMAAALALLALGPGGFTSILLVIIAAVIGSRYRTRAAVIGLVLLNLAFLAIVLLLWRISDPGFVWLVYGLFQFFALLMTLQRVRAEQVSQQLREVNAQLLATRELLTESARDGERLRVSRELHDVAGHRLTALALNLDLLGQEDGPSQRREWRVSRGLVTELLAELRSVVASLRRHDGIDVREALRRIADAFPAPHIHLELDERVRIEGAERADAILRAGQEGLTNAVRHADAHHIWLSLSQDQHAVRLEVRDDGTFRGVPSAGYGLRGIRERVELLGGSIEAGSSVQGGFRLQVALPVGRQS